MHKQAGFTLLEIFLIVGALIIISAIAAPSVVTWRDDVRLTSAAERFGDDVQKAKSRAVRDGKTVIIEINSNTYRVFVDTSNGNGGTPNGTYEPNEPVVCDRQLPRGIRMKLNDPASTTGVMSPEAEDLPVEIEGPEVEIHWLHGESQPSEHKGILHAIVACCYFFLLQHNHIIKNNNHSHFTTQFPTILMKNITYK